MFFSDSLHAQVAVRLVRADQGYYYESLGPITVVK
jgi:hypothetical protein